MAKISIWTIILGWFGLMLSLIHLLPYLLVTFTFFMSPSIPDVKYVILGTVVFAYSIGNILLLKRAAIGKKIVIFTSWLFILAILIYPIRKIIPVGFKQEKYSFSWILSRMFLAYRKSYNGQWSFGWENTYNWLIIIYCIIIYYYFTRPKVKEQFK